MLIKKHLSKWCVIMKDGAVLVPADNSELKGNSFRKFLSDEGYVLSTPTEDKTSKKQLEQKDE